MMIAGITLLAIAFCLPELRAMEHPDFEKLLPIVLSKSVPAGVVGLMLAGLLAAFMSNFAATINAAPAYLVNDIYKRFINPNSSGATDIWMSRAASIAVLAVGIGVGLAVTRIMDMMLWITGALYSGYVMANVLKWIWWRFNGYGYFWGMSVGILGAMLIPEFAPRLAQRIFTPEIAEIATSNPIYFAPVLLVLSLAGCLLGTYLSTPEDMAILKHFYRTTRPWGFWGPVRDEVLREDPNFRPNNDFAKDAINVAVGIVWQTCLTALPIFLVLRSWEWAFGTLGLLLVTSLFIKFNWYDKLPSAEEA
jgi:SSS family solute:Na+ symporter